MSEQLGVLSSSLFRIMTGHAKCDALLTAVAHTQPSASTAECHELPARFASQEFQRHAFPPASADRRSLKGSYFVPLTAVAALLRSKTPFFLRETLQRALVDNAGRVVDDFADARIVRDSTKRARGLSQLEAQDDRLADAQAHWASLRNLLRAIDAVLSATATEYDYLEIPPCPCASCRKHVDSRANVRLLIFSFVADMSFVDIVVARRRTKGSSPRRLEVIDDETEINNNNNNNSNKNNSANAVLSLPLPPVSLPIPSIRSSLDSFVVPPPPPIMPTVFGAADTVDIMSKSLSNQFVFQMRAEVDAEVDAAVEKATQAVRARYESRLQQSQEEVRSLRNQVEQLQRQLAQMTIGSPMIKSEFLGKANEYTQGDSNDSSLDELLMSSVSSLKMSSPPRKRRQVVEGGAPSLQASSSTALCRESAMLFDMPPHSPTEKGLFVF